MKGFLGSANVDTNSRLCMASTVAGHRRAFGEDIVPGCYEDLDQADLIVLVGSNTAWCHPILYQRMIAQRRERGAKIVVIDPRRTATGDEADLFLALRRAPTRRCSPACWSIWRTSARSTDVSSGPHNQDLPRRSRAPARSPRMPPQPPQQPASMKSDVARSSTCSGEPADAVTCYLPGREPVETGHRQGQRHHQLPSRHRPHRQARQGPLSLTGQPNAMGGREVGGLANQLAAHMILTRRGRPRAPVLECAVTWPGAKASRPCRCSRRRARRDQGPVGDGDQSGDLAAARCCRPRRAQKSSSCSSSPTTYSPNDTIDAGPHVMLPAAAWGEKDGTVTNSERRISRQRKFLPLPGEAQPGLAHRRRRGRSAWASSRHSPIARWPTRSASTPRCPGSRTMARGAFDHRRAGGDPGPGATRRWNRCSGRSGRMAATHPRSSSGDGRFFTSGPQGAVHRNGTAGAGRKR